MLCKDYYTYLEKARQKQDTLKHYGTKGMHWGVRLWQNYDGTFNEAGKQRYFGKKSSADIQSINAEPTNGILLEYLLIKYPVQTLATAAGLAALYVTSDAITAARTSKNIKRYEEHLKTEKIDKKTGLRLKDHLDKHGKEMTPEKEFDDDVKKINMETNYELFCSKRKDGYTQNCMLCTTAMDLRQRGYDVRANKELAGYSASELKKWYKDPKIVHNNYDTIADKLKKEPEGSYGNLMIVWKNSFLSGHSMFYRVKDGNVEVYCTQTRRYMDLDTLKYDVETSGNFTSFCRTDNLEPNYTYLKQHDLIKY